MIAVAKARVQNTDFLILILTVQKFFSHNRTRIDPLRKMTQTRTRKKMILN